MLLLRLRVTSHSFSRAHLSPTRELFLRMHYLIEIYIFTTPFIYQFVQPTPIPQNEGGIVAGEGRVITRSKTYMGTFKC